MPGISAKLKYLVSGSFDTGLVMQHSRRTPLRCRYQETKYFHIPVESWQSPTPNILNKYCAEYEKTGAKQIIHTDIYSMPICTDFSLYNGHRIIGWQRPLRSPSPTVTPTPPCLLNHVPKCHTYTVFEPLQGWGLHHCPGQPGPTPDHSCSKDIFPNNQSEPPLMQLEAIASRYLGEETSPRLTTPSCQGVVVSTIRPPLSLFSRLNSPSSLSRSSSDLISRPLTSLLHISPYSLHHWTFLRSHHRGTFRFNRQNPSAV